MAVTKSTLNTKLPKVSKIAFCTSAGKDMCTTLYTAENGKFSIKVGFKQNTKTYPFQIQYRYRNRWTAANAKKKGADWSAWSSWRNAVDTTKLAYNSTKLIDTWLFANKGVNKNSDYRTFKEFSGAILGADYDAREYQYRIRCYSSSKKQHGNFTYQKLRIYKKARVYDETIHATADGGLVFDFNYKWDRGGSVQVNSIIDAEGIEILNAPLTKAANHDSLRTETTTPAIREGYTPAEFYIEPNELTRTVEPGEKLTVDAAYVTDDNASTKFVASKVNEADTELNPISIAYTYDELSGVYTLTAQKTDSNDFIQEIDSYMTYQHLGKEHIIKPYLSEIDNEALKGEAAGTVATYYYRPPLNVEVTAVVSVSNNYRGLTKASTSPAKFRSPLYMFTNTDKPEQVASCWDGVDFSISTSRPYEIALPFGREKEIVFYGSGNETKIKFSANILDAADQPGGKHSMLQSWIELRNNQGVYDLRTPHSEKYKVAVTDVQIKRTNFNVYQVAVSMNEVV